MLDAGKLRHRVNVQQQITATDPTTGTRSYTWQDQWEDIPAGIEPLSARELIAAQAQQSQVTGRIVLRYLSGLTAKHRIVHGSRIYSIHGVIPDPDSGIEFITLPVSEGVNDGA